jgi:Rad3-related DNA helicase
VAAERTVAVRDFIDSVAREGDLHTRLGRQTTAEEGIAAQKALQSREEPGYEAEVFVSHRFQAHGQTFRLRGRADGLRRSGAHMTVDEVKASRAAPGMLYRQQGRLHWAQVECYAAMLALITPEVEDWTLRLRYVSPEHSQETQQVQSLNRDALLALLALRVQAFGQLWALESARRRQRDLNLAPLQWPLASFRRNQRALAGTVYGAAQGGRSLLLEASTGIGKTLGVLYPTLRALPGAPYEQVLFLTARNSGAMAAERALQQLATGGATLRWLRIEAKQRSCGAAIEGCESGQCPRAAGYYDRLPAALQTVGSTAALDASAIRSIADRHRLCPFELSLDLALWVDVIIADYNYVFDPETRIKRLAQGSERFLLIDEAHQLSPRVIDALSAEVSRPELEAQALRLPAGILRRAMDAVAQAVAVCAERLAPAGAAAQAQAPAPVEALEQAIDALIEACLPLDWQEDLDEAQQAVLWTLTHWRSRSGLRDDLPYVDLWDAGTATLRLRCLDASAHLHKVLESYTGNVRFSGTLRPLSLQQQLHGQTDSSAETIGSPYTADQLAVAVVTDIPTYLRQRAGSLPQLVALVDALLQVRAGTYLLALPSFAYLEAVAHALTEHFGAAQVKTQRPGLNPADQQAFLASLSTPLGPGQSLLCCVVLGGVFTESVDYSGLSLEGIVCVGVGLAPPGPEQAAREAHYQSLSDPQTAITLTRMLPAMNKVVQAAGRLLRGPDDRGVLCLIDDRFARAEYQQFFPAHWSPRQVRAAALPALLENFWHAD